MKNILNLNSSGKYFVMGGALFASFSLWANEREINKELPKLKLEAGAVATDNLNPTLNEELSALGSHLQASGNLTTSQEGFAVDVSYLARRDGYKAEDDVSGFDDSQTFVEMSGRALLRMYLTDEVHIDAEAGYQTKDEKFGEGLSRFKDQVLNSDNQTQKDVAATVVYGSDVSRRFVSFKVSQRDQTYEDNNDYSKLADLTQKRAELDIAFRRSVSGLYLNFSATDDDYDDINRADNTIYQALIGGEWKFTGSSTFKALVGKYWNNVVGQEGSSGVSWLVNYDYSPRDDLELSFSSSRSSQASELESFSTSIVESYLLNIDYNYSDRWRYGFFGGLVKSDFEDDFLSQFWEEKQVGLETTLTINDLHSLLFMLSYEDVTSSDQGFDYKQGQVRLNWLYTY